MSYGEAVLERGAGRRYRWKGRPGLSHKSIKNVACLSDSMSHKAPAEMGGFASSAPSARSGEEVIVKVATFRGHALPLAGLLSPAFLFSLLFLTVPLPAAGENKSKEVMLKP